MDICLLGVSWCFFFQAEDGIRDLVRSRGLGDVYKRQGFHQEMEGTGLFHHVGRGLHRLRAAGVGASGPRDLSLIHI